jgi:hypothetical protein
MNVLLDIIGSTIFVGILIITIFTVNNNMVMGNFKSITTYEVQTQAVQLGRIIEYDIYKMGYNVTANKILAGDTARIKFRADLENKGKTDTVEYLLGSYITTSANPRDRQLSRVVNGNTLFISYNVTKFYIRYYDSLFNVLTSPLSAASLLKLRQIKISMELQTPDPVDYLTKQNGIDTLYTGAYYEKLISPRNLQLLM